MSLRKLGLTAALLASSLGAFWTTPASASCQTCITDQDGNKHCYDICMYHRDWWWMPPDVGLTSPIDIVTIVRDLQSFLRNPTPASGADSQSWILLSPVSKRAFIVDLKTATMTEVVSGAQTVAK